MNDNAHIRSLASLRCSHTQSRDVNGGSGKSLVPNLDLLDGACTGEMSEIVVVTITMNGLHGYILVK